MNLSLVFLCTFLSVLIVDHVEAADTANQKEILPSFETISKLADFSPVSPLATVRQEARIGNAIGQKITAIYQCDTENYQTPRLAMTLRSVAQNSIAILPICGQPCLLTCVVEGCICLGGVCRKAITVPPFP